MLLIAKIVKNHELTKNLLENLLSACGIAHFVLVCAHHFSIF